MVSFYHIRQNAQKVFGRCEFMTYAWLKLHGWGTISDSMGIFGSSPKIVIVEDNEALAEIYKTRLEIIGYKCYVASDGEKALTMIEHERPHLVLLDLMVPKVAGDQILATMRASEWGKDIKVYIISNLNESDAPAGLREHGIEGYSVKANLAYDDIDQVVNSIIGPMV
jgi:CheY-like chemotaxis protein